jgi:hypothetical protein
VYLIRLVLSDSGCEVINISRRRPVPIPNLLFRHHTVFCDQELFDRLLLAVDTLETVRLCPKKNLKKLDVPQSVINRGRSHRELVEY